MHVCHEDVLVLHWSHRNGRSRRKFSWLRLPQVGSGARATNYDYTKGDPQQNSFGNHFGSVRNNWLVVWKLCCPNPRPAGAAVLAKRGRV